jgi:hypothetical protein
MLFTIIKRGFDHSKKSIMLDYIETEMANSRCIFLK